MATVLAVRASNQQACPEPKGRMLWSGVCALLALMTVELMVVPIGLSDPTASAGASWRMGVCEAFANHLRFGTDLVFTMGPLSFLYADMPHPSTYWLAVGAWSVLAFGWWLELRTAACSLVSSSAWQFGFVVIITALAADTNQLAYCLLLLGVFNRELLPVVPDWRQDALWGACLALLGLAKFSLFGTAAVALFVGSLLSRRYWRSLVAWSAGLIGAWVASGQSLFGLGTYICSSLEISSGYAIAMTAQSLKDPSLIMGIWLGLPLTATVALGFALRRGTKRQIIRVGLIQLFTCLAIQKLTCTRMESTHLFVATQVWLVQTILCYLVIRRQEHERWHGELFAAIVGVMAGVAMWCASVTFGSTQYFTTRAIELGRSIWCLSAWQFPSDNYYVARDMLRAEYSVPKLKGPLDAFPDNCAAAMAAGDYRGRPVLQAYSAYTKPLEEMNGRFMRSESAPQHILFEASAIDDRFPMLEDSRTWLEMISRYTPEASYPRFELLKRQAVSPYSFEQVAKFPALLKHPFSVPWGRQDLIWAEIDVRPTLIGALQAFFFHIMPPIINVSYSDGSFKSYRLPINMARAGFLLSPVVLSNDDMCKLIKAKKPSALPQRQIAGFVIEDSENKLPWSVYKSSYSVRLCRVAFFSQDGGEAR